MKLHHLHWTFLAIVLVLVVILGTLSFHLYNLDKKYQNLQAELTIMNRVLSAGGKDVESLKYQMELFDLKLKEMQSLDEDINQIKEVYDQAQKIKKHIDQKRKKLGLSSLAKDQSMEIAYNMIYQAQKYNVDINLISSVCYVESHYNVKARGKAGERGLMQVMPGTFQLLKTGNFRDWKDTLEAGVKHLSALLDIFDGNIEKALAGYNAGSNRKISEMMEYGGPYAKKVSRCYYGLNKLEKIN